MDDTLGIGVKIDIQDAERALNVFINQLGKVGIVSNDTQNKLTQTFTELSKSSQSEIAGKTAKALEVMRKAIDEANASIASMPDKMDDAKKNVEKIEKVCAKLDAQLHKLEKKRELLPTNGKEFKELTAKMVGLRSQLSENNVSLKSAREEVLMLSQSYEQAKKSLAGLEEMQSKLETGTLSSADITSMLEKVKQGAGQATIEVDKLSDSSERASLSVGKLLGTFGGMIALKQLGNEIIRVRGEFQQADVAIQTMLGSKQEADALLSEVRQYASISPLEFGDITRATQMMLGFNIEAEKVPEYIRAIGDISMGEGEKFKSLTLAFSQMSATGKLMGQDLMQMINAGFNPLQVIAEQTGKSIEQLKEEMSDGAISAEMVQNAFIKATSAGGKFYKMSENASKTINGQLSMMQDAIDSALNNVGTASENIIISGISGITSLIENYEKVGRVLEGLVLTYGAYRTAVALVTFAENGHTLAMTIARAQILLTQKAQALLNATMLANPYVLAATALGALVGTLVATTDGLSGAERAQRNFNSTLEEAKEKQKKYREETDNAIEAANNDKTATDKRREAMNLLIARYPDIIQKYIDETGHLKDILQLKKEIAAIDGQTTVEELNKKSLNYAYNASVMRRSVNAQLSAGRKLSERDRAEVQRIKDLYFKETGGNWWDKATTSNREIMEYFEKQSRLNQNQAQRAHTSNSIAAFQDALAGMDKNKLAIVQEQIQRGYVGRLYPELKGANLTKEDLGGLSTYVSGLLQAKQNAKVDKRALEKQKEEAQNALEALSVEAAAGAEGLKLRQKIAAIDKQLEPYSASYGKSKGRGTKENDPSKITELRNAQDVSNQRAAIDLGFSTREAEIKKQAEGTDKMLAQIELDKDREIEAIRRAYEDMRLARVDEAKKLWDADSKNKGNDFYKSDAFKQANVNTEAEEKNRTEREQAVFREYERAQNTWLQSQRQTMLDYLKEYGTFEEKKLAISKEYADKIRKAQTNGEKLSLQQEFSVKMNELDSQKILQGLDMASIFSDFGLILTEPLKESIEQLRKLTETKAFKNRSFEEQKTVFDAIEKAEKALGGLNGLDFSGIANSVVEYNAALADRARLERELADAAERLANADTKLTKARLTGNDATVQLAQAEYNEAESKHNLLKNDYAAANAKVAQTQAAASSSLEKFNNTLNKVDSSVKAIYNGSLKGIWDLLGRGVQDRIGGLVSGGLQLQHQFDNLVATLTKSGVGLDNFATQMQDKLGEVFATFTDETTLDTAKDAVNKMIEGVFKESLGDDGKFDKVSSQFGKLIGDLLEQGTKKGATASDTAQSIGQTIGELLKSIGKGGEASGNLWGAIIGVILQLLDEFAENGLGRFIETLLSKVGEAISGILGKIFQDLIPSLGRGIGQLVAGVVEGVVNLVSAGAAGSFLTGKDHEEEYKNGLQDWENKIEANTYALEQLTKAMTDKTKTPQEAQKERDAARAALQGQIASLRGTANYVADDSSDNWFSGYHSWYWKRNDEWFDYNRFNNVLAQHGSNTRVRSSQDVVNLSADDIQILRTYAGEAWADYFGYVDSERDPNEVKKYLEEIGDLAEKDQEIMDNWYASLTNMTFDALRDNFKSNLMDMSKDREDFLKDFSEDMMDSMLDTMMSTSGLSQRLKEWQQKWGEYIASGNELSEDEIRQLREEYQKLIDEGIAMRDKAAKATGYGEDEAYQQKGSTGAWESLGEDTGKELNGRFTALQITGESLLEVGTEINQQLSFIGQDVSETRISVGEISANIREIVGAQNAANEYLSKIEINTRVLPEMRDQLTDIQRHVNNI